MIRRAFFGFIASAFATGATLAADLTDTEMRWLRGAWPVVAYARSIAMPLDVVVQPQPTPGNAPLALAFIDGRCKLVFSMRENPEAEATLARVEPALLDATLELMAAHELGHCRRYLDGAWHGVPSGFSAGIPASLGPELGAAWADMRAARREEGYGDLVGLAWTERRHPQAYARLHAWLLDERSRDVVPGSPHDTLAWVRLAAGGAGATAGSIFDGPAGLWTRGLAAER
jgi:hypothetical protein